MQSKIILFIFGFLVWSLLTWLPDFFLKQTIDLEELLAGVVVAGLVTFLTGGMFSKRPHLFRHIWRYLWFVYYIGLFSWECIKANLDVAFRVLHPHTPLKPGIVKIKTSLKSDTALTYLANSITLTPGTLTLDIDKESGILYIHWIDVKSQDINQATEIIAKKFERVLKKIFD
jgi:multicomponent Na+:H+ antiporter subunit E